MILQHYPDASFEVGRGQDDPAAIHLMTTVDVEDTDDVIDVVIDRLMQMQIEDDLPIFVIPVRPTADTVAGSRVRVGRKAAPGR